MPDLEKTGWRKAEIKCETKRYNVNSLDQYHRSYGFRMIMLATEGVPNHTTHALLRTLYQRREARHQRMRWMIRDEALVYCPPTLNVHAGARAYLVENDLIHEQQQGVPTTANPPQTTALPALA